MATPIGCLYPDTILAPDSLLIPIGAECTPPTPVIDYGPGGGGHGALMNNAFFERYEVAGKWRGVKRVKIPTGGRR